MSFNKSLGGILVISNGLGGHFAHFQFCKGILVIIKILLVFYYFGGFYSISLFPFWSLQRKVEHDV